MVRRYHLARYAMRLTGDGWEVEDEQRKCQCNLTPRRFAQNSAVWIRENRARLSRYLYPTDRHVAIRHRPHDPKIPR